MKKNPLCRLFSVVIPMMIFFSFLSYGFAEDIYKNGVPDFTKQSAPKPKNPLKNQIVMYDFYYSKINDYCENYPLEKVKEKPVTKSEKRPTKVEKSVSSEKEFPEVKAMEAKSPQKLATRQKISTSETSEPITTSDSGDKSDDSKRISVVFKAEDTELLEQNESTEQNESSEQKRETLTIGIPDDVNTTSELPEFIMAEPNKKIASQISVEEFEDESITSESITQDTEKTNPQKTEPLKEDEEEKLQRVDIDFDSIISAIGNGFQHMFNELGFSSVSRNPKKSSMAFNLR